MLDPDLERLPRGRHRLAPERVADNQRHRLFAAATAVFAEHGYLATTSRLIAADAGVSSATFYAHFANVSELLGACFERVAQSLAELAGDTCDSKFGTEARTETALAAALGLAAANPRLLGFELLVGQAEVAVEHERLTRRLAQVLGECDQHRGRPRRSAAIGELLVAAALATIVEGATIGPADEDSRLGAELAQLLGAAPL